MLINTLLVQLESNYLQKKERNNREKKRHRKIEEVKSQKVAKQFAEQKREQWIKETYLDIIYCARSGKPWSQEKYLRHVKDIESPYVCSVGNYRVATGGVDKSACFKTLAGEIISGAISGNKVEGKNENRNLKDAFMLAQIKRQKKMNQSRTENTIRGSDGMTAERRLTWRLQKDVATETNKKIKGLSKNIVLGKEVLKYIENLKKADLTLTRMKVKVNHEYWEINTVVIQEKLKNFLKLWYFPAGGGKLSMTKVKQLEALKAFNLTKEGVDDQIDRCKKQLQQWKREIDELKKNC